METEAVPSAVVMGGADLPNALPLSVGADLPNTLPLSVVVTDMCMPSSAISGDERTYGRFAWSAWGEVEGHPRTSVGRWHPSVMGRAHQDHDGGECDDSSPIHWYCRCHGS